MPLHATGKTCNQSELQKVGCRLLEQVVSHLVDSASYMYDRHGMKSNQHLPVVHNIDSHDDRLE